MKLVSGQGEWEDQQAQRLPGRPLWSPESQGGSSWGWFGAVEMSGCQGYACFSAC